MDEQKPATQAGDATELKPGETISPRQDDSDQPAPRTPEAPQPARPAEPPQPAPTQAAPEFPATPPSFSDEADLPDGPTFSSPDDAETPPITWTASEFIAHNKSPVWYVSLAILVLLVAAAIFLLTHDIISTVVIVISGIALGVYGARQPRQVQYALSPRGLLIANRYFPFDHFRSFAILDEGAISSIVFMPLRRFGQMITIYFDPADEERIVDLLAVRLPLEHKTHDLVDQFMRRIRF